MNRFAQFSWLRQWTVVVCVVVAGARVWLEPVLAGVEDVEFVPLGAEWRVWVANQVPSDPADAWKELGFDDGGWLKAASGFATPEADWEMTVLSVPVAAMSVCLRTDFGVADPVLVRWLVLRADYDDAFVAYLNGVEVARKGFAPKTSVRWETPAEAAGRVYGSEALLGTGSQLLRPGRNLLAVEVHRSPANPSLAFVPELLANFTRGPQVGQVDPRTVEVRWHTPVPADSRVDFGVDGASAAWVADTNRTTVHRLALTNLVPGLAYEYRVSSSDGEGTARTAPARFRVAPTSGEVTFTMLADSGGGSRAQRQLARVMSDARPDLVLHGGDVVYPYPQLSHEELRCFSMYRELMRTTPFYPVVGNHEVMYLGETTIAWLVDGFSTPTNPFTGEGHFYSFDYGDAHFVAVFMAARGHDLRYPAYSLAEGSAHYQWLTNDLATTRKPWKIVLGHVPLASSGPHRFDSYLGVYDQPEYRRLLLPVFERYGVQLFLCGHDHLYERLGPLQGVHLVVSGGGGGSIYGLNAAGERDPRSVRFQSVYHCLKVRVAGDTLRLEALGVDGRVLDEMSIQRAPVAVEWFCAAWHTPSGVGSGIADGDGNAVGQWLDFRPEPIPAVAGRDSNLGRLFVNNDRTNLYLGFWEAMTHPGQEILLFVESPRLAGVSHLAGLGNGLADAGGEGADALDFVENLAFTNFTPTVACVLGDEGADGTDRGFARPGSVMAGGQGVFRLDASFSAVAGTRIAQYNDSPQWFSASDTNEQNANFIEVSIPLTELGGVQGGDVIGLAAVVANADVRLEPGPPARHLDRGFLGRSFCGYGFDPALLEGVKVRLATDPDPDDDGLTDAAEEILGTDPRSWDTDGDGLCDGWEARYQLDPLSGSGMDGHFGDVDGDGMNNGAEQVAGTDPRDGDSCLRVNVARLADGGLRMVWSAVIGRSYRLETAIDSSAAFEEVVDPRFPRTALSTNESVDLAGPMDELRQRYYRLRVMDPNAVP